MKAIEVLARLDTARELLSAFPPEVDILSLNIEEYFGDSIHIYENWQELIDKKVIPAEAAKVLYGKVGGKANISVKGINLFHLTDKKTKPSPALTAPETTTKGIRL